MFIIVILCLTTIALVSHFQNIDWFDVYMERGAHHAHIQRMPAGISLNLQAGEFVRLMKNTLYANSALLGTYYSALIAHEARETTALLRGTQFSTASARVPLGDSGQSQSGSVTPINEPSLISCREQRNSLHEVILKLKYTRMMSVALLYSVMSIDERHQLMLDLPEGNIKLETSAADEYISQVDLRVVCWQVFHLVERSIGTALPLFVTDQSSIPISIVGK